MRTFSFPAILARHATRALHVQVRSFYRAASVVRLSSECVEYSQCKGNLPSAKDAGSFHAAGTGRETVETLSSRTAISQLPSAVFSLTSCAEALLPSDRWPTRISWRRSSRCSLSSLDDAMHPQL